MLHGQCAILTCCVLHQGEENSLTRSRSNSKIDQSRKDGKVHIIDPLGEIPELGGVKQAAQQAPAAKAQAAPAVQRDPEEAQQVKQAPGQKIKIRQAPRDAAE